MSTAVAGKGLEGIVAANSGICWIDGEAGMLSYRGIDIHELAEHSTFEETTYLLWNGVLPNRAGPARVPVAAVAGPGPGLSHRRHAAQHSRLGHAHGGAAHGGLGAQLLRRRREGQLPRRQRAQELPPDRADGHDRGHLRPAAQGTGDCAARPLAEPRRQLSLDAERRQALRNRRQDHGHGAGTARRPRVERLHLRRPRHRRHPLRRPFGRHRRHRRAQGSAARRRQRRRDADALRHRQGRRRPGRIRQGHAGRPAENLRLRPSRLQDRGPARHPPAQDERAAGQGRRPDQVVSRCPAPSSSTSTPTRS